MISRFGHSEHRCIIGAIATIEGPVMHESTDETRGQAAEESAAEDTLRGADEVMSEAAALARRPVVTVEDMQKAVLTSLRNKRGILDGRDLYRVYRESDQPKLRLAIKGLEKSNLVSVKGDLEAPLGVFQSVLVERGS
jgi:hypothetical protein